MLLNAPGNWVACICIEGGACAVVLSTAAILISLTVEYEVQKVTGTTQQVMLNDGTNLRVEVLWAHKFLSDLTWLRSVLRWYVLLPCLHSVLLLSLLRH